MGDGRVAVEVLREWLRGDGVATLDRITAGSPDVVGVIDLDYVVHYVNWTAPGLTRDTVIGHSTFNLIPPECVDIARAAFDKALRSAGTARFEMLFRGELGALIWVVRVGPIVHEGKVIGAFTISTDVTEERRGTLDRDRFFALSLDMLAVVTPAGHLKRVNPAFGTTLGYDVVDIVGRPFSDFVHPDDLERTLAAYQVVLGGMPVTDFENRYGRRDGEYRVFSWRATVDPVTGDVYAVARDITEQRATEAQLRHAQKMEAVGQLAGGIAHDFNNLMQAVLGNVDLALANPSLPPPIAEHFEEIAGAGHRAAELTKQLLVFSRRQPLRRVPIDLNELMQGLMKLLRRLLPESISIELRPSASRSSVSADRTQLEQVIVNLCVNARDAMASGGKLSLETDHALIDAHDIEQYPWVSPGQFVRLRVTDTGVGMSAEVRERAFEPFFTTKGHQSGTGLGLATVYGIVQQHGGFVHVDTTVDHGTTFDVCLPVDERAPAASRGVEPAAGVRAGHETILVAEDEPLARKPLIQLLEGAGYKVLAASNGREALRIASEHPGAVDLAILDVVMPELDGSRTWEQLKTMRPGLRVIFMSGYADEASRHRLPPDAEVLEKPFDAEGLWRSIRRQLDP